MSHSFEMPTLARRDKLGRPIRIGDWVRLVEIPPSVKEIDPDMDQEMGTRKVFKRALGKTFKIEAFNRYNLAELDLTKKVAKLHTIWVEPEYLLLFRRKQKLQKQKK